MFNAAQTIQSRGLTLKTNIKNTINNNKKIVYVLVVVVVILLLVIYMKKYQDQYKDTIYLPNIQDGQVVRKVRRKNLPKIKRAYTLAMWFYIDRRNYNRGRIGNGPQKIISKGSQPAVSVNTSQNNITIEYKVKKQQKLERIVIKNIDLNRWNHLAITAKNNIVQIYFNGLLIKTNITKNTVAFNKKGIKVGNSNLVFLVAQLRYTGSVQSSQDINTIYTAGPKPFRFPDIIGKIKSMFGYASDSLTDIIKDKIGSEITPESLRLLCKAENLN